MKKNRNLFFFFLTVFSALFFIILFIILNYVENEGFNPSDDGVILAQAYRLFNGEIPHKDFISIRPVFSGILHGIHLISPLPLQISARWFVLLEYFTYSFLWIILIFKVFKFDFISNFNKAIVFIFLAFFCFLLNVNNYNLYPWTTIDAIFLSVAGFWFFNKIFEKELLNGRKALFVGFGLSLFSLAALSRQNFILLTICFFVLTLIVFFRRKELKALTIVIIAGSLPFIIYFIYLIFHKTFGLFLEQMTARTELFQTGVIGFLRSFVSSWLLPVHIIVIAGFVYMLIRFKANINLSKNNVKFNYSLLFIRTYFVFYLLVSFFLSSLLLIKPGLLFHCSYELFWIYMILSLSVLIIVKPGIKKAVFIIFPIILAWISAISLGDNVPVFATGIIGVSIPGIFFAFNKTTGIAKKLLPSQKYVPGLIPLTIIFLLTGIYGQREFNYRDRPSRELSVSLKSINKEFGGIKTNLTTYDYFLDLNSVIDQLGGMENIKDRVVVIPNNALFYPLYKTKNPFPLDWLQREEYIGSEEYLHNKINQKLQEKKIFLIMDKFNSKNMAFELSDLIIGGEKYDYRDIIDNNCDEVNILSDYFFVKRSRGFIQEKK